MSKEKPQLNTYVRFTVKQSRGGNRKDQGSPIRLGMFVKDNDGNEIFYCSESEYYRSEQIETWSYN